MVSDTKLRLAPRHFRIEAITKPSGANTWDTAIVSIFKDDDRVGSYERNLSGWAGSTFEPFEIGGRWFALYAPDYTSTRVISLPDCIDKGGEAPATDGFCPVEFWVPRFKVVSWTNVESGRQGQALTFETDDDSHKEGTVEEGQGRWRTRSTYGRWQCLDIGFIAGCVWGDDSSWKVQAIDLSQAAAGSIERSERFGYLQLPRGMSLHRAIALHGDTTGALRADIIEQRPWNLRTGQLIDPFDL